MKITQTLKLVIVVLLTLAGCMGGGMCAAAGGASELAFSGIGNLKVEEIPSPNGVMLHVQGLDFNSALTIETITQERAGDSLVLHIFHGLAKPGATGRIDEKFLVPAGVTKVFIENTQHQIWPTENLEKEGFVHFLDFDVLTRIGISEEQIEAYGKKYTISKRCFLEALTGAVDADQYDQREIRAKIIFKDEPPVFINRDAMTHRADRFDRIDKEKFKSCLKPLSASQNREAPQKAVK